MTAAGTRVLAVLAALLVVTAGVPVVAATPPAVPAAFYGSLTVGGQPAPAGTTVTAVIDGEVRGTLTTDRVGVYGGPGAFDGKLQVDGTTADEGAEVVFRVNGAVADRTGVWAAGSIVSLDLAAPSTGSQAPGNGGGQNPGNGNGGGQNPGNGQGPGAGPGPRPGNGQGPGGGQGGPPAGGPSGTPADQAADVASVAVQPSGTGSGTGVAVSVTGARANVPVEVNTSGVATQAGEVAVDAVSLTPLTDGNFTLDVSASTTPDQVSQTFPADAADALGVVTVTHSIPDRDIGDVRFRLRVAKATLAARGLAAEEVVLYRFSGTWAALNTTVVAETDAAYVVEAVSPGLSTFVLAPARPVFVVQEPTGPGTTAVAGTTVTFGVTVENTGARPGQRVVDLVVDGVVDGSETVELAPGERRTVTLTHRFAAAGTYQVSLADQSLGTLSVSAEATEPSADQPPDESELSDPTPEPTTTDAPASGPSVSSQPALLGLVGLVALVLALLSIALARRR